MKRRTLLTTTGTVSMTTFAGCLSLSGGEPSFEVIGDPPSHFRYSDIETRGASSELLGESLIVQGTLENIGDEYSRPVSVRGVFYNEDDVRLGDDVHRTGTFESVAPGGKVLFKLHYFGDPSEVARYTVHFGGDSSEETATGTIEETPEETPEEPPEPSSEYFSDDWENGQYTSDPKWNVGGDGERGYIEIVSESAPGGGNYSLSLVGDSGGGASASTHQDLRFDVEWLTEALFKPVTITDRNHFRLYLDADFSGPFNAIGVVINIGFRDGPGETELTTPNISGGLIQNSEPGIVIDWEENRWYHLKCHHDGDGVYRLKVWDADQTEPSEYQTQSVGETAGTGRSKFSISQYVARGQANRTNVARISHTTFPSGDEL